MRLKAMSRLLLTRTPCCDLPPIDLFHTNNLLYFRSSLASIMTISGPTRGATPRNSKKR